MPLETFEETLRLRPGLWLGRRKASLTIHKGPGFLLFSSLSAGPQTSFSRQMKAPLPRAKSGGTWSPHPPHPHPPPVWEARWRSPRPLGALCVKHAPWTLFAAWGAPRRGREGETARESLHLLCAIPVLFAEPPHPARQEAHSPVGCGAGTEGVSSGDSRRFAGPQAGPGCHSPADNCVLCDGKRVPCWGPVGWSQLVQWETLGPRCPPLKGERACGPRRPLACSAPHLLPPPGACPHSRRVRFLVRLPPPSGERPSVWRAPWGPGQPLASCGRTAEGWGLNESRDLWKGRVACKGSPVAPAGGCRNRHSIVPFPTGVRVPMSRPQPSPPSSGVSSARPPVCEGDSLRRGAQRWGRGWGGS